ncbi:hypothetical protein GH714_008459 [Hevea brasiliensis]|uniref:Protein KAKU4 n=1 Tax=Hevea brasiliensis TaxID=3981 RepID=A0A6A6LP22_HEVBR|nr:hypothetical protein GH714_008459 [Hevea brasiliensis]
MASIPRPHGAAQLGSGGKLVRPRRTTAPRTPYERPLRLLPNSASQNPNWLSSLILSPTRMIATGAGKVLSSVFGPVSSSSSSSSSGGDFTSDVDMPDIRSTAITEAKKWLEEKKLGSNSKSELVYGTCTLNAAMLPQVMEDEVGSPADLAKSYMQARPPWASPSLSNIQLQSPSPRGIQLFKEETPNLFGGNSAPSSKLIRNSSATGSWNILEEIRKVRSKATEEMLRTRPSSKLIVSQRAQDGLLTESSPPDIASSIPEQSQGPGAIQIIEGAEGLCDGTKGRLNPGQRLQPSQEMRLHHHAVMMMLMTARMLMGFANLYYTVGGDTSLTASLQGEHNSTPSDEQHHTVDSAYDNLTRSAHVGETCEQLSESYVEVPIVNEHEELSQDLSSPNLKNKADKQ